MFVKAGAVDEQAARLYSCCVVGKKVLNHMLKKVPLWAWVALAILVLSGLSWWLTGDSRAAGGSGLTLLAPKLAKGWSDRAARLRERAAAPRENIGDVLDAAEAEGMKAGMKAESDQW